MPAHNRALPTLTEKEVDRFWSNVSKTENCWLWSGRLNEKGYGIFRQQKNKTVRKLYTHRLSYLLATGEDPGKLNVNHACDVRNCVNPDHLSKGTQKENMDDAIAKRRVSNCPSHVELMNKAMNCLLQMYELVAA